MRKFIYTPIWKIEKTETVLTDMAKKGYRLTEVKFSSIFYFSQSSLKENRYFFTWDKDMTAWESNLLSEHNANAIKTKCCYFSVFEIAEPEEKLYFLKGTRAVQLERSLFLFVMVNLLIFVPALLSLVFNGAKLFFALSLLSTVYSVYIYFKQHKRIKDR